MEAVLDVVFPLSMLALPVLAVIYLAGLVFGKAEVVGFVKLVATRCWEAVVSLGNRCHRAAVAFVVDEEVPGWQIEDLFIRLDRLEEQVSDLRGRFTRMEEDFDHAADDVSRLQDEVNDLRVEEESYVASSREYQDADLPF